MSGAFDRHGQLALMFGAGARLPAGADLAIFSGEAAQQIDRL